MKSSNQIIPMVAAMALSAQAFASNSDGSFGKPQAEVQQEASIRNLEEAMQNLYEANAIEIGADNKVRVKRDVVKELIQLGLLKTDQIADHSVCN